MASDPRDTPEARQKNKDAIIALMNDPRYKYCVGFYPDTTAVDKFGYGLPNLLPQLWWEITECRIHPCGIQSKSHWRLSLSTAASATPGKRTFFNPNNGYLYDGYSQLRIGPGNDNWGPGNAPFAYDKTTALDLQTPGDVSFTLPLSAGTHTLKSFLDALLVPTAYPADGVVADAPMAWFHYSTPQDPKQCRFWVQAAARAFYRAGLLAADPSPVFEVRNRETGYPEFPKTPIAQGQFFARRPGSSPADPGFGKTDFKTKAPLDVLRPFGTVPDDDAFAIDPQYATRGILEQNLLKHNPPFPGWI